jgi:hypothetical protein
MRFLAAIGALAIVVGIGCAPFSSAGIIASPDDRRPAAVTWALTRVRTASINRHAYDNPPPRLATPRWCRLAPKLMPVSAAQLPRCAQASHG